MPKITATEARRLLKRATQLTTPKDLNAVHRCERDGLRLVLEFPFSVALLKNHRHTLKRHLTQDARDARDTLINRIQTARLPGQRRRWPMRKTWLTIQAWKPSHHVDCINLLDAIADAAKAALAVDDRWFSVRAIDWSIDRIEPRVQLTIEADSWDDQMVCKQCGGLEDERLMLGRRLCLGCQGPPRSGVRIHGGEL